MRIPSESLENAKASGVAIMDTPTSTHTAVAILYHVLQLCCVIILFRRMCVLCVSMNETFCAQESFKKIIF